MSDFLFELGVEEVPVSEIKPTLNQLKDKFQAKLEERLVEFGQIETAATNKRFMVYFGNINEKANDKDDQIKGPAKRIAYDENNQPTIALQKFLEFNRLKLADLEEMETKKGTYLVVSRKIQGQPTFEILTRIIPEILKELTFSKTMVWNVSRVSFIRPIKNILAIFDRKLIPVEFGGVHSTFFTYGHILLSDTRLEVKSYRDYCEKLGKNFVILREEERKEKILAEVKDVEEEFAAHVKPDDSMLEDYIYTNEYPVVFHGNFDTQYLELPSEIIATFMTKEKKLLPVFDKQNKLLNIFVGVSNIPDESRNVTRGNERVIRATFEDAKFFWDNDRKDDFVGLRELLKNVTFHKDLGSYYEKTDRLASLVDVILKETNNGQLSKPLRRAALLCKNDLVTRMVREFPSLQGIMGGLYLKEKKEAEETWKAVYGHYEPKGFQPGSLPLPLDNPGAGILSIVDKIDSITGFISGGIKISSSKDPYGIRRDANAIIKILIDFKLDFNLDKLIETAASLFAADKKPDVFTGTVRQVQELFISRLENIFKDFLKFRYDVVNAVLNTDDLFVYKIYLRVQDVSRVVRTHSTEDLVALHRRLKNIIKDADLFEVSEDVLEEKEEKILYDIFKESGPRIETMLANHQYLQGCTEILQMKPVIDDFFDKVMVMAEDRKLRENRIALVQQLDQLLSRIADFSLIVE